MNKIVAGLVITLGICQAQAAEVVCLLNVINRATGETPHDGSTAVILPATENLIIKQFDLSQIVYKQDPPARATGVFDTLASLSDLPTADIKTLIPIKRPAIAVKIERKNNQTYLSLGANSNELENGWGYALDFPIEGNFVALTHKVLGLRGGSGVLINTNCIERK